MIQFIEEYLEEANIRGRQTKITIELLHSIENNQRWLKNNGRVQAELPEIPEAAKLTDLVESDYPFAIDPMTNLYFTRDPFATIECSIIEPCAQIHVTVKLCMINTSSNTPSLRLEKLTCLQP